MAALDIEYIEIYTLAKPAAISYFTDLMGFVQVAESAAEGKESALLRQGSVQLLVTDGPATRAFLDRHGDGVADIALACDDVAGTGAAAAAAGVRVAAATSGNPVVAGFGDVVHTLYPLPAADGMRLPADRPWTLTPGPSPRPGRIGLLDHVAICLEAGDLDQCADFYADVFGLERYFVEYVEVGDQAMGSIVVRGTSGGVTFTILEPDALRSAGQLDAFLDRNAGPGVQHVAFAVGNIISAVGELRDRGVKFLETPGTYYDALAERLPGLRAEIAGLRAAHVLADRDESGYLLQLFTRSPHERNTLFYELIQRRGAKGFGSANIRALYEAVERDRLAAQ
jgi:4-hydroxymandelate synthase